MKTLVDSGMPFFHGTRNRGWLCERRIVFIKLTLGGDGSRRVERNRRSSHLQVEGVVFTGLALMWRRPSAETALLREFKESVSLPDP